MYLQYSHPCRVYFGSPLKTLKKISNYGIDGLYWRVLNNHLHLTVVKVPEEISFFVVLMHYSCFVSVVALISFRNPCIQLFYGFLLTGGTAIFTFKVIPYFDSINTFIIVEYLLIVVNLTFFWLCSSRDAGVIMRSLHSELMSEYALDGHFYSAQECYTCNFAKPARSKHCCE